MVLGDPVDTALLKAAIEVGLNIDQVRTAHPLLKLVPFSSERKMMTTLHQDGGRFVALTKGAPGIVLTHCSQCENEGEAYPINDNHCQEIRHTIQKLQSEGMYVLGLAHKSFETLVPDEQV